MRIPADALKEFVDIPRALGPLAERLTRAGLETTAAESASVGADLQVGPPCGPALEVDVTPNRGDCLSVLGVAREVGALLGKPVRLPRLAKTLPAGSPASLTIEIRDRDRCSRYVGVLMDQVAVGPSPDWLAARLREFGVRSINNVVDITNLVRMELGQPLHAFDADAIRNTIVVRRAAAGESLVTLDGVRRDLADDDLVIADADRPIALAGVMGGAESGITEKSTRVLLEAAWFEPRGVRRAAQRHGCSSESSVRFERGVDPDGVARAARRAVFLLTEHAGARAVAIRDVSTGRRRPVEMTLRSERVERLLGIALPVPRVRAALQKLGFEASPARGGLRVTVPSWRSDVMIEADLVEEVARFIGYDEIPSRLLIEPVELSPRKEEPARVVREALLGLGFNETMPLGFTSVAELARLRFEHPAVRVTNPLSQDQELLPPTLLPGLLRVAAWNHARQAERVAVFEIGTCFLPARSHSPLTLDPSPPVAGARVRGEGWGEGIGRGEGPVQELPSVAAVWSGPLPDGSVPDVLWIKGVVEAALSRAGVTSWRAAPVEFGGPGRGGAIEIGGKFSGVFGEMSRDVAAAWGLEGPLVVLEVSLSEIGAASRPFRYAPASPYPSVDRDIALVLDAGVAAGDVEGAIREAGRPELRQVRLFDVYLGSELGEGKRSLAFRLRFQSLERTLTDVEVREAVARIVQALAEKFGAVLRA